MRGGFRPGSGRKRVLSESQVRRLVRMREVHKMIFKDIAPSFGITEEGAWLYYRRERPVERKQRASQKLTDADIAKMKELRKYGLLLKDIATRFGLTADTVRRILKRNQGK